MIVNSKRGAARVNIVWLIALIVGMLVAVAFGFVANDEAAKEREAKLKALAEKEAADTTFEEVADTVREISRITGFYDREAASPKTDTVAAADALATLRGAFSDMDPSLVVDFEKAVPIAVQSYNARGAEINQLKSQIEKLRADVAAKDSELRALGKEKDAEIAKLTSQLRDAEQAATDKQAELEGQIASVRDSLRESDSQLRNERSTLDETKRQFSQKEEQLRTRIREQGKKLAFLDSPAEPDGSILAVNDDLSLAWIDIGSDNRLARGTRFRVIDGRVGSNRIKAWAEVTKVKPDMAEVLITNLADPFQPVVAGDKIYNPVYDPKGQRYAVLVGRFSGAYNEKELGVLLGEMGITVQKEIDPRTDYLILGQELYTDEEGEPLEEPLPPTELPEYKDAEAQGVVIIPLKDLREYFRR